jgi:hypothetical protein
MVTARHILNSGETFFHGSRSVSKDKLDKAPAAQPFPSKERDRVELLEWIVRPEMRTRNDYALGVVWAALIGLVAIAFWFKVPLG